MASPRVSEVDIGMRFADTNVEICQAGSEQLSPRSAGGEWRGSGTDLFSGLLEPREQDYDGLRVINPFHD